VLAEFGLETRVVIADGEGHVKLEAELAELLPGAFGAEDLRKA
jgi:cytidine deaminase